MKMCDCGLQEKIEALIDEHQKLYDREVELGYNRPPYVQSFAFEYCKNILKALLGDSKDGDSR
jgi:hypothetical protein